MFIGISGIIGVGKSTLTESLANYYGFVPYFEPVKENLYLDDFYKDPKKYGAIMQLYLLTKRFKQHQEVVWSGKGAVQDRTIYEDTIFADMLYKDGLIEKRDYDMYVEHFNLMKRYLIYPDLIIHLNVDVDVALSRIRDRSRGCETGITIDYLKKLKAGYDEFVKEMHKYTQVLVIDYNKFQPIEEIAWQIKTYTTLNSIDVKNYGRYK